MRDVNRISKFLVELAHIWYAHPDLRFGQLLINVFNSVNKDVYYIEDDELIELIKNSYK